MALVVLWFFPFKILLFPILSNFYFIPLCFLNHKKLITSWVLGMNDTLVVWLSGLGRRPNVRKRQGLGLLVIQ